MNNYYPVIIKDYMRTIIAGTRTIKDLEVVVKAVRASKFTITEVVSGTAKGVDQLGEQWAERRGIPITSFKPDWSRYGRGAGTVRNKKMAEYAEALVAVWDGKSKGTKNMIEHATQNGLQVYVHKI